MTTNSGLFIIFIFGVIVGALLCLVITRDTDDPDNEPSYYSIRPPEVSHKVNEDIERFNFSFESHAMMNALLVEYTFMDEFRDVLFDANKSFSRVIEGEKFKIPLTVNLTREGEEFPDKLFVRIIVNRDGTEESRLWEFKQKDGLQGGRFQIES